MTQEQQEAVNKAIEQLQNAGLAGYLSVQPQNEQNPLFKIYEIGSPKKPRPE